MGLGPTGDTTRVPRGPGRPKGRPARVPPVPQDPLLALQGAAGNRAVTALVAANARRAPVQRQPPDSRTPGTADPRSLAPRVPDLRPTGLMYVDPEPAPAEHRGGDTWNLEFQMYGTPHAFTGLDDEGVIKKLQAFYFALLDDMKNGRLAQESWRTEMGSSWSSRWAAAASSVVGGADWPDPGSWFEVDRQIAEAFGMLRESLWSVMAARNEAIDPGARAMAKPLTAERMAEIVAILEKGDVAAAKAWDDWKRFLDKTDKGAARAVTGLKVAKVAGAVAVTYLTGGAAASAELGLLGTSTALAATGGTYAAAQNLAEQGGEMLFGDRDHIDWGAVAKAGAVNAAASFVGGVVGGKFAGILGNALGKLVGGLSPEAMQAFGIEGAQLLTNGERIFIHWLGNVASSPFQTSTTVLMQTALDGRWTVTSSGDFLDMVLHDMLVNGTIGGFFSLARAAGSGSRPAPGGGGPGEGGGGGGGGGGAPPGRPTLRGMGAAGPAGENAPPWSRSGDTLTGMGAAGPAGENAPPATRSGDTLTGVGAAGPGTARGGPAPTPEAGSPAPEIEMPVESVGHAPLVTEHAELVSPINRQPGNRMSVSGYPGSLPEGYGVFRHPVRLASGQVVEAAVKIYPGERGAQYESEVGAATAAARTGRGPRFYGRVPVAMDPQFARRGQADLAFAMEPVEGAFAQPGVDPGEPGYAEAVAQSAEAAGRINDRTFQDVRDFARAILDQGYVYGGSSGGEVQGLVGPGGRWTPIDFQGLRPLPTEPGARADAVAEQDIWVQEEINGLERARNEHHGIPDEDPTDPGR